jgi:uridine phosphorylase
MSARAEDLQGNGGIGRYLFLPGSNGRAAAIAERFLDVQVREHPRGHDLHIGKIERDGQTIDVGAISTGMGCPSLDIIVNELFRLGGRRFLRVGTCGSLQPKTLRAGGLVVATAAVRDEATSRNYVPLEVPAVASLEMLLAARAGVKALGLEERAQFGTVHCKDSLYARELGAGPMAAANAEYMRVLEEAGTLASEMESSQLFTLAALFDREVRHASEEASPANRVLAGTVLAVIGDDAAFGSADVAASTVDVAIDLAFETVIALARSEAAT